MPRLFSSTAAIAAGALNALLFLSTSTGGPSAVEGHAVMIEPQTRPWMEYLKNYNYLPHQVRGWMDLCLHIWPLDLLGLH